MEVPHPTSRYSTTWWGRLRRTLYTWDERAFTALSRRHNRYEDALFVALTRLGDHSRVWMGTSAALAALGGRRGRRVAVETMAALGLASLAANVVIKFTFPRRRPLHTLPALIRRKPRSRSFPSGHTATSFAAATVLSARYHAGAPLAYALAGGVGLSRVHVGVHFPLDVLAGAALGTAAGAAVVVAQRPSQDVVADLRGIRPHQIPGEVALALNAEAGDRAALEMPDGITVHEVEEGVPLDQAVQDLVDKGADVVGVAGGDGTVGCAARIVSDSDRALWVFPVGTLNHFARALGIPDHKRAVEVLEQPRVARVDIAEADGTVFVNNASFGIYSDLVRRRESYEDRLKLGKWPAMLLALVTTLSAARPLDLEIDGQRERAFLVFIGNNPYDGVAAIKGRVSLQSGVLDVRVLRAKGRFPRLGILASILTGRLRSSGRLRRGLQPSVTVRLDTPCVMAHDGEVRAVEGEISFRSRPGALKVLVPSSDLRFT